MLNMWIQDTHLSNDRLWCSERIICGSCGWRCVLVWREDQEPDCPMCTDDPDRFVLDNQPPDRMQA